MQHRLSLNPSVNVELDGQLVQRRSSLESLALVVDMTPMAQKDAKFLELTFPNTQATIQKCLTIEAILTNIK